MQMIYGRNCKSNLRPPFVISQNKNKDLKGELWYLVLIRVSPKTQSNGDPVCWPACLSGKWLHGPLHRWAGVSFCCYVMSTPLVSWCFFSYFVRIKSDLFNCTPHCSAPKWKSANEPTRGFLDEWFHGRAALVGSMTFVTLVLNREGGEAVKNQTLWSHKSDLTRFWPHWNALFIVPSPTAISFARFCCLKSIRGRT